MNDSNNYENFESQLQESCNAMFTFKVTLACISDWLIMSTYLLPFLVKFSLTCTNILT